MIKSKQTFSIRETAEILVPDKVGRVSYTFSLALSILMTGIITLIRHKLPLVVPLYFTFPWGEARLVPQIMLYLLPAINLALIVCNLGLGRVAGKLSPLLSRVLAVGTIVVSVMLTIALIGILQSLIV